MSDNEDEFEDAVEGPEGPTSSNVELTDDHCSDTEIEFDEDAALKEFDDEHDRQEVLRQAQESEELAIKEEEVIDDGHERSIEEAVKAKAEGNE
jgi:hypothetical protein